MAKSYREKKAAYDKMQGVSYFEPDMNLLRDKNPKHPICKRKYLKPEKHQKEALWSLLDILSVDEIVKNRRAYFKKAEQKRVKAGIKELGDLLEKAMNAETLVAAKALSATITEKSETMPEVVKAETLKVLGEQKEILTGALETTTKVGASMDAHGRQLEKVEEALKINTRVLKEVRKCLENK